MVYQPSQNSKKSEQVRIRRTAEIFDGIESCFMTESVSIESSLETLLSCFDLREGRDEGAAAAWRELQEG